MAMVKELKYKVDINTLHRIEGIDKIAMNDIGRISLRTLSRFFMTPTKKTAKQGASLLLMSKPMKPLERG